MNKILKRVLALSLCAVMIFSVAGCHRANERALKIDKSEYTTAFYSCALVFADMEGQQLVSDTLGEDAAKDYLNQTLEGVDYKTWVKNKAIQKCKENEYYKNICETLMLKTEDYYTESLNTADFYWDYYGYSEMMEKNGVGRGTFRSYMAIESYRRAYFDYIYKEGGAKEIANADIEKELTENYLVADILSEDLTNKKDEEKAEIRKKFDEYAKKLKEGDKFEKIYADYTTSVYTEDTTKKESFSYSLATVLGNDKTDYQSDNFDIVKAMKNGEIKVEEITQNKGTETETITLYLFFKGDILSKDNTSLEDLKDVVRHSLKDEEFENECKTEIDAQVVEENTGATKRFKVEKIYYPAA